MRGSETMEDPIHYTISHFREIARQNRSAENASISHDRERCAICDPALAGSEPFAVYLEVSVESVLVRRPRLDEALVAEMNSDREMVGLEGDITIARLLGGEKDALDSWAAWVREALATGLGLLSVHSPASLDFDLEEQEMLGYGPLIESKIRHIIETQKKAAQ
ncbi:MAG: hypothetical protein M1398_02995 [Deltaproteobacteria bacterium]|nr:hypothetical protein [Deltaproteobacteria bacterium]MDA8308933.1 hypothetical protein [Deltaproteobacteria bacterium]